MRFPQPTTLDRYLCRSPFPLVRSSPTPPICLPPIHLQDEQAGSRNPNVICCAAAWIHDSNAYVQFRVNYVAHYFGQLGNRSALSLRIQTSRLWRERCAAPIAQLIHRQLTLPYAAYLALVLFVDLLIIYASDVAYDLQGYQRVRQLKFAMLCIRDLAVADLNSPRRDREPA